MSEVVLGVPPLLLAGLLSFFSSLLIVGIYRAKDRAAWRRRMRDFGPPPDGATWPGHFDNLKRIRSIDANLEAALRRIGVTSYQQIGDWTFDDTSRVSRALELGGRIERESWIEQAKILASGGETFYSRQLARGVSEPGVPSSSPAGAFDVPVGQGPAGPVAAAAAAAAAAASVATRPTRLTEGSTAPGIPAAAPMPTVQLPRPAAMPAGESLEAMDYGETRIVRRFDEAIGGREALSRLAVETTQKLESQLAEALERARRQHHEIATLDGRLVHQIPEAMRKGVREVVEVRLGAAEQAKLADGLLGHGALVEERLTLVETMTVELLGPTDAFLIEPQSPPTQDVSGRASRGLSLTTPEFGRWVWQVTPKKAGTHELTVKVVAHYPDSRGVPTAKALPDKLFTLKVAVNFAQSSWTLLKWLFGLAIGGAVTGLVAAASKDYWWPLLKDWLERL